MAALTSVEKRFLVAELAMYATPSEAAVAFKERFGKPIGRDQVHRYNAGHADIRERMSAELGAYFDAVRERWEAEDVTVPIANKRKLLEELQKLYDAQPANARKARQALLEHAAKEVGGAFTNKRDLTTNGQSFKALVGVDLDEV